MNLVPGSVTDSKESITGTFTMGARNGHMRKFGIFKESATDETTKNDFNFTANETAPPPGCNEQQFSNSFIGFMHSSFEIRLERSWNIHKVSGVLLWPRV